MKRKLTVTITKVRRQTASSPAHVLRFSCPTCGRAVEILGKSQAAQVLEVGEGTLEELIAEGRVHAIASISGNLWVCKDSLFSEVEGI